MPDLDALWDEFHAKNLTQFDILMKITKADGRLTSDPAELKLALICLRTITLNQSTLIAVLNQRVTVLEAPKKPWYKRLFRK